MSITLLNNISSLIAENAVSATQTNLQNTLQQLSTGLKINSGADDPAGLSVADGLGANISALTQSSQNASNGVGLLQTADGALSQVTNILNQAVTIATEASNGGLTTAQAGALNTEFTSILNEINQIGSTTNFNGTSVFNGNSTNSLTSVQGSVATPLSATTALTAGDTVTIQDSNTGGSFVFKAAAGNTLASLATAITNAVTAGTLSTGTALTFTGGQAVISNAVAGDSLTISSNDPTFAGGFKPTTAASDSAIVFTSDGTSSGATATTTTINTLSSTTLNLNTNDLLTTTDAQSALTAITNAISSIAAQRGNIGASVNQLTADTNVENTEVQNLTNAQNNVQNADIASTTSKLTQYNILEQTGFAALQQSNQAEQNVLKLVQ
jgi:flagellin